MKKLTTPLLGMIFLVVACNKQDAAPPVNEEPETTEVQAEPSRQCAAHEVLEQEMAADPQRRLRLEELERFTELYKKGQAGPLRAAGTLYIPVVVNIVLPNPAQVTDAQIRTQVDVLKKDFTKTNTELSNTNVYLAGYPYGSVANCQLEYVVTKVVRKVASGTFGTNNAVKRTSSGGQDPTTPTTHLNIWVCDLSSGLLGYAQFPGGNASTDGVVIDYQAFGTAATYPMYSAFKLGRTATHEIGHWLNLRHIWGDTRCGNDGVADTPQHDASNSGCPNQSHRSKCSGRPLEQWMNYMDYTYDACMYMFSGGQKTRMDAAIDGSRAAYVRTTRPTSVI